MALRIYQARVFKHLGAATSRLRLFHSKQGSKVVSSYAVVTTGDVGNLEALTAFVASRPNNQLKISPIYHSACKPVSSEGVPRYKVVVDMSGNKFKAENLQLSLFNIAEDSCDEREGGVWEIEGGIGVAAHYALYIQVMKTVSLISPFQSLLF